MNSSAFNETVSETVTRDPEYVAFALRWRMNWDFVLTKISFWFMPTMGLICGTANLLCLINLCKNRSVFPRTTKIFMGIIMAFDILTCYVFVPLLVLDNVSESSFEDTVSKFYRAAGTVNYAACMAYDFCSYVFIESPVLFHIALLVERMIAVIFPMKVSDILCKRNIAIILVMSSVVALIPPTIHVVSHTWEYPDVDAETKVFVLDEWRCIARSKQWRDIDETTMMYVYHVIPIIIFVIGTIVLIAALRRNVAWYKKMNRGSEDRAAADRQKMQTRVTHMLIYQNLLYIVCGLPAAALPNLVPLFDSPTNLGYNYIRSVLIFFFNISYDLLFFKAFLSWPCYFIGANFRKSFVELYGFRKDGKPKAVSAGVTETTADAHKLQQG